MKNAIEIAENFSKSDWNQEFSFAEIQLLARSILEAEKVIRDHSGGMWHRCDGNWDWANEWLKKYAKSQ